MSSLDALNKQVTAILTTLERQTQPQPVQRLPFVVCDDTGKILPQYQERATYWDRLGIPYKRYLFDPDDEERIPDDWIAIRDPVGIPSVLLPKKDVLLSTRAP